MIALPAPSEANLRRIILPYLGLPLIIVLFYILGAVSGSQTKYWWISIEIDGVAWNVGGLSSCRRSAPCSADLPAQVKAVQRCLQFHFAVAPIVAVAAASHFWASRRHEGWPSLACRFLLPGIVFVFTLSSWLADLLLVHSYFKVAAEITALSTKPSYWLSTAAFLLTLIWLLLAEFFRRCRYAQYLLSLAPQKPRRKRPPTTLEKVASWWPWAR